MRKLHRCGCMAGWTSNTAQRFIAPFMVRVKYHPCGTTHLYHGRWAVGGGAVPAVLQGLIEIDGPHVKKQEHFEIKNIYDLIPATAHKCFPGCQVYHNF